MGCKVVIVCGGDHVRGMGHVYRMKVLASVLSQSMDCHVAFLVDPETIVGPLMSLGLADLHILPSADLAARRHLLSAIGPDLIVVDEYGVPIEALVTYRDCARRLMVLDNPDARVDVADCVVNPIIGGLVNRTWVQGRTRYYAGPRYMILHPDFARLRPREVITRHRVATVCVAMGGADTLNLTDSIVEMLLRIGICDRIVMVKGFGARRTELSTQLHSGLRVVDRADNLALVLRESDLAITGGGITLYEAACMGVPAIAVAQAPHEQETARRFQQYGSAMSAPPDGDGTVLLSLVKELTVNWERRRTMASLGLALLDGNMSPFLSAIRSCLENREGIR